MHLSIPWQIIGLIVLLIVVALFITLFVYRKRLPDWTGFGPYVDADGKQHRGKKLWDWLDLMVVPIVIAVFALVFTYVQDNRQIRIEDNRIAVQATVESDIVQEARLQDYIDDVSHLLVNSSPTLTTTDTYSISNSLTYSEQIIVRSRTQATIRRLNPERISVMLRFLDSINFLSCDGNHDISIDLRGIDLSESDLTAIAMCNVWLDTADMNHATLVYTNLSGVDMNSTNLSGTSFVVANLSGANLYRADLSYAILKSANLRHANLINVNLLSSDLRYSDLKSASLLNANLTNADLRSADLSDTALLDTLLGDAIMNGVIYDSRTIWPGDFVPPEEAINFDQLSEEEQQDLREARAALYRRR